MNFEKPWLALHRLICQDHAFEYTVLATVVMVLLY